MTRSAEIDTLSMVLDTLVQEEICDAVQEMTLRILSSDAAAEEEYNTLLNELPVLWTEHINSINEEILQSYDDSIVIKQHFSDIDISIMENEYLTEDDRQVLLCISSIAKASYIENLYCDIETRAGSRCGRIVTADFYGAI